MPDETKEELKLKASQLTYPPKDDGKGSARINWQRRGYYFGKHNTSESFQLFCEWRSRLIETGDPTEVRIIRRDLAHDARKKHGQQAGKPAKFETAESYQRFGEWLATMEESETRTFRSGSVSLVSVVFCVVGIIAFSASFATFLSTPNIVTAEESNVEEPVLADQPMDARQKARLELIASLKPVLKGMDLIEGHQILRDHLKQLDAEKERTGSYDSYKPVFD
ncbi:MAG: hypothetical protein AB8B91_20270 [Rubripirellula sp.]